MAGASSGTASRFPALENVDLTVADKEFVALVGPSGCGKTTCLRMAAGFEVPSSGRVLVGGVPVDGPGPDRAVVFQQFALFPWKSVADNIAFGLRNKGIAWCGAAAPGGRRHQADGAGRL